MFFSPLPRGHSPADKSLGDLMPALDEKRLRKVHEGEVHLALRPSGIGEVGVDKQYFHLVRWVKAAHTRGANAPRSQLRLDLRRSFAARHSAGVLPSHERNAR